MSSLPCYNVKSEVQYWSKYVLSKSQSFSASHSYSQIYYLFEPLESTECPHSHDAMSSLRYNIGPSMSYVRVKVSQASHSFSQIFYLFEPLESTECLHSDATMLSLNVYNIGPSMS